MKLPLRGLTLALVIAAAVAFPAVAAANFTTGQPFTGTLNKHYAPTGAHLGTNSATPTCTIVAVDSSQGVSCNSYDIQGFGNTNATLDLSAIYTVTYLCTNHGRQLVVAQTKHQQSPSSGEKLSPQNGSMHVPEISVGPPSNVAASGSGSPCPNPNWTWTSSVKLTSFDYTLQFDGFSKPAIEISATDP